jgi:hypothetical protein
MPKKMTPRRPAAVFMAWRRYMSSHLMAWRSGLHTTPLKEDHLHMLQYLELHHENMVRAYDKLVKRRVFRKGELVLVLRRPIVVTHKTRGKFEPKWEGPYAIEQAYDGGAYQLVDPQGARPMLQSTEGF